MRTTDWLVFSPSQSPEITALFDRAVAQISSGNLPQVNRHYPIGLMVDQYKLLGTSVLEYRLSQESVDSFHDASMRGFVQAMRALIGWDEIDYPLHLWVETHLRDPYFVNEGSDWDPHWVRRPDVATPTLCAGVFRFACDVAIADLQYGPSYASVSAARIFDWVTQLGSALPAQIQKNGTGALDGALAHWVGEGASAHANDALAVIRITIQNEAESAYGQVLDYLQLLLSTTDFPRSYAIEFRGPSKHFLPIAGLPKKGVHQLFACAAVYPGLHDKIEVYARTAIRAFHWYHNLEGAHCAMPGSFAVFALALAAPRFAPLTLHYLRTVDGEHQSMQGKLVEAYIDDHGFTETSIAYLLACVGNIEHLRHRKTYPALMAHAHSLTWLLQARKPQQLDAASPNAALRASLAKRGAAETAFRLAREVIWPGAASKNGGQALIRSAPEALQPLYAQIFA